MNMRRPRYNFLSSLFTRSNGYTKIKSSSILSKKQAVSILNSFTPQGASPKGSIRIATYGDMIGAGYYWMENESTARISTFLTPFDDVTPSSFLPPLKLDDIPNIAKVNDFFRLNIKYDQNWVFNIARHFGNEKGSAILYSLLSGDNLIIVHSNTEERLKFIAFLLTLIPSLSFKYNRITSGCTELDGNENIVGVDELPRKFRSHKKLYLPLDTIFIDLKLNNIEGEGIKNSDYTRMLMEIAQDDMEAAQIEIFKLYKEILERKNKFSNICDDQDMNLVNRIEVKLGLRPPLSQDWMMF